ncbi:MAG: hypothetical protein ACP6IY_05465 [Promethearchaeia archaeon]
MKKKISFIKLSESTKVLNFLLACFKKLNLNIIRIIFELNINLKKGSECKPDLFCLLKKNNETFYSLFEFKKRTVFNEEDINLKLKPQYLNYKQIEIDDLDTNLIPKISDSLIFINYLFYNSEEDIINQIINYIPIESNVYLLQFKINILKELLSYPNNPNYDLMREIIHISKQDTSVWKKLYIPFTLDDILLIKGMDGKDIRINNNSGIIFTDNLLMFIISRKIQKKKSTFYVDELIDYIFKNNFSNLNIGWEYREALRKKINLALKFISNELPSLIKIKPIIKKIENKYQILLKNTESLEKRVYELREKIIEFLKQRRIIDYF